jgi:hypothetical protein
MHRRDSRLERVRRAPGSGPAAAAGAPRAAAGAAQPARRNGRRRLRISCGVGNGARRRRRLQPPARAARTARRAPHLLATLHEASISRAHGMRVALVQHSMRLNGTRRVR